MSRNPAVVKFEDYLAGTPGPDRVKFLTDRDAAMLLVADVRRRARAAKMARLVRRAAVREAAIRRLSLANPAMSRAEVLCAVAAEVREAELATIVDKTDASPQGALWLLEDARDFRRRLASDRAERGNAIKERLKNFVWLGGDASQSAIPAPGMKSAVAGFVEPGLRSTQHPHLERFVKTVPRARSGKRKSKTEIEKALPDLMTGSDKANVNAASIKLFALDDRIVEGNKLLRSWWRIDNDAVFTSWAHLRHELSLLPIPMPHFATAEVLSDGRVIRPHLFWYLPVKGPVRFDEKAPALPKALWSSIQHALAVATTEIGSDVDGGKNPCRVKNPLFPHHGVAILSEADPLTMTQMADQLGPYMNVPEREAQRMHAAAWATRDGVEVQRSNALWSDTLDECWTAMRDWRVLADPRAALRGEDLAKALMEVVRPSAETLGRDKVRQAHAIVRKAARFVGRVYDEGKAQAVRPQRGVLSYAIRDMELSERQAAGAAFVAKGKVDATVSAIRLTVAAMRAEGMEPTQGAVAKRIGKSRGTVVRRWPEAMGTGPSEHAARCAKTPATEALSAPEKKVVAGTKRRFAMPYFIEESRACRPDRSGQSGAPSPLPPPERRSPIRSLQRSSPQPSPHVLLWGSWPPNDASRNGVGEAGHGEARRVGRVQPAG